MRVIERRVREGGRAAVSGPGVWVALGGWGIGSPGVMLVRTGPKVEEFEASLNAPGHHAPAGAVSGSRGCAVLTA